MSRLDSILLRSLATSAIRRSRRDTPYLRLAIARTRGVSVGVDDPQLGVSFGQSFVDELNFADQLRSELNPFGEEARYAVAAGFQFVVVV
jgi:hypothetical protein